MLRAQAEGLRVLKRGDLTLKVLIADFNYPDLDIERRVLGDAGLEVVEAQCRTEGDVIEAGRGVSALLSRGGPAPGSAGRWDATRTSPPGLKGWSRRASRRYSPRASWSRCTRRSTRRPGGSWTAACLNGCPRAAT